MEEQTENTLVHLDIFTNIKRLATATQQIYIIKCFNIKQPKMLSTLNSGMLCINFKYNALLMPGH